jgi:flavin reductase (DIM6/NTAB) family NADH-FMN oxidoreductase RutF
MPVSSDDYRDVLRHFPSGVTIVTIKSGERVHGLTVSAFASVSPNPPTILVTIDKRHSAHEMLQTADAVFAVNILAADQAELSNRFAWTKDEDRFVEGEWGTAVTGAPILQNSLAWMDCHIAARHDSGTHVIYVGVVQATGVPRPDEEPLVYWNRDYRNLDPKGLSNL